MSSHAEFTPKRYKGAQAIGIIFMLSGFVVLCVTDAVDGGVNWSGVVPLVVGSVIYLSARIAIWWNHQ